MSEQPYSLLHARPTYKPHAYPWAYEAWHQQQKIHWLPEEVPLGEDVNDWQNRITPEEKNLLTQIFRFFTQADVEVASCYNRHYMQVFKPTEVLMMLSVFSSTECFDAETELLTSSGWVKCPDLTLEHKFAQYDLLTQNITFTAANKVVCYPYNGPMHHYKNKTTDLCVTPNHDLIVKHPGSLVVKKAKSIAGSWARNYLYPTAGRKLEGRQLTSLERLLIAVAADGTLLGNSPSNPDTYKGVMINISKERKIIRLRKLLELNNITYSEIEQPQNEIVRYRFKLPSHVDITQIKNLGFLSLEEFSSKGAEQIVQELLEWDGSQVATPSYYSTEFEAISKAQAFCVLAGKSAIWSVNRKAGANVKLPQGRDGVSNKTCWVLTITDRVWRTYPYREIVNYSGNVYCVSVPSQNLVSRRNGKIAITGNTIHIAAYSHLLDTVGMPEIEYSAFLQYKEMKDKYDYMQGFSMENKHEIAKTLAAFGAFTEGLQLFASFAILLNFPRFNKMKGMGQIITWSVRDETLHCLSVIKLFRTFLQENQEIATPQLEAEIREICSTIVEHEDAFIDLAFAQGPVEGLTPEEVKLYIRYIGDRRLIQLGYSPQFNSEANPLPWIDDMLNAVEHSNFFEQRSTEYSRAATQGSWEDAFAPFARPEILPDPLGSVDATDLGQGHVS